MIESHAASDAGSVISGHPGPVRVTSLCLTPQGTQALTSIGEATPSVPMLVTTLPHAGPLPGSSVPLPNPGGTTLPRRTMSVRLASGAATPDNGSVVCECPADDHAQGERMGEERKEAACTGALTRPPCNPRPPLPPPPPTAAGMGGSATASRRPIASGFYPPISSPLAQPNFAGTAAGGGAPHVQLRSPPPAYAGPTAGMGSPSLRHGIASPQARFTFTSGGGVGGGAAAPGEPAGAASPAGAGATPARLEALLAQLQLQSSQLAAERSRNASLEARLAALEAAMQPQPQPEQQRAQ